MTMPAWWVERRFGVLFEATVATVPAWAPIGENASWYRCHIADDVDDVVVHPSPMVEVLAHHRDRWGHVEHYDDFVPLLNFDRFDAEAWTSLIRDAGAGYAVHVAKHHDGWAWWDAPGGTKLLTEQGPRRNVVAEFAAACERNDIVFGAAYSLLDWGDERYPQDAYVDDVLHPHVLDLVERYGVRLLRGDGEWAHDAGYWKTAELMRAVRELDPDVVIDSRWWASGADVPDGAPAIVTTYEYDLPSDIRTDPWELRRGVGSSFGHNRAEPDDHQMTGIEIVDLLTEVVAKGGNLLLAVGPTADGTIPPAQVAPLRDAGTWIRRHRALLADTTPWTTWGDSDVRYLDAGSDLDAGSRVIAIDIAGSRTFGALDDHACRITEVSLVGSDGLHDVQWAQDDTGLTILSHPAGAEPVDDPIGVAVYRIATEPVEQELGLFGPIETGPTPLGPLLADAQPGDIVQLGDGTYEGPAAVPPGVTLRGFGPKRTTVIGTEPQGSTIVPSSPILTLGQGARVEHLAVEARAAGPARFARPLIVIPESTASLLGVTVAGSVSVSASDVLIRAVTAQGVVATDADRLRVSRCQFTGNQWDVAVDVRGGEGHEIESSQLADHLCAIRLDRTAGSVVRGNTISARWWGVHLRASEGTRVHANRTADTMRAVDIEGGTAATVDGNAVSNGDSGCIVHRGASECQVYGNHWDRCRVGLVVWGDVPLHHQDNVATGLLDEDGALVTGP